MRRKSNSSRSVWLRYGVAVIASAAAVWVSSLVWPLFRGIPFMPAFLAIFVAGWFGGGGPSLLAVALSAAGIDFLFYRPAFSLRLEDPYDALRLGVFVVAGSLGSLLFRQLWATRRRQSELIEETERAREAAEAARRETDQILASITDGFCALDREFRYRYVNRQGEKIMRRSREELLGRSALEAPPLGEAGIAALRRAMEEGETSHAQAFDENGRRWIAADIYPAPEGAAVLFRDITDRKQAQEGLQRLAAIVESSEDSIISKDLHGVITSWNAGAERLFGYSAAEILGKPVSVLMPPEQAREMDVILERIRRGERVEHFETVRVKKNGEKVPVSLTISPIKDTAGNVIGASKIARDITERRKSEAERERLYREAQEAARVREDFLAMAGHELRTPLTTLQFHFHTLRRRLAAGEPERASDVVERARAQLERLVRLTEEILDVTRITSGRLALERDETDLAEVVWEVAERHRDAAHRAGCDIRIEAQAGATGLWDRSRLDQVATNLLSNAVKFGKGKPIEIRVEPDTTGARLTVRDHGIGISPEDQSKIFERFERAVSRRSYGGMGLGLWISRQIVDAHGGTIEVMSEPGQGSTFRVELPRHTPKGAEG